MLKKLKMKTNEITRKILHLSSSIYPLIYWFFFDKQQMTLIIGWLFCALFIFDHQRTKNDKFNAIVKRFCGFMMRESEFKSISSATYFVLGCFLAICIASKKIAITAMFVLILSDTMASFVGMNFGKIKLIDKKTLEGSVAFFVSTCIISIVSSSFFDLPLQHFYLSIIFSTFAEMFNKKIKIDDNLLIPVIYALSYAVF